MALDLVEAEEEAERSGILLLPCWQMLGSLVVGHGS
jgi:hypothetical protein